MTVDKSKKSRLAEAVEQALSLGDGLCGLLHGDGDYRLFSTQLFPSHSHMSFRSGDRILRDGV